MLKKTIEFQDLDGNKVTEDFYFSLSKAELAEMELGKTGGFRSYLMQIIQDNDGASIIKAFKEIIFQSVGRRSEDGRRFIKSEDISNEFMQTDAYSVLFMELVTDAQAGAVFVNAVMPADLVQEAQARGVSSMELPVQVEDLPKLTPEKLASLNPPTKEKSFHELTPEEISRLDREQLLRYLNQ